eukprot:1154973-Pelagomonas_calceolata.AAC.3
MCSVERLQRGVFAAWSAGGKPCHRTDPEKTTVVRDKLRVGAAEWVWRVHEYMRLCVCCSIPHKVVGPTVSKTCKVHLCLYVRTPFMPATLLLVSRAGGGLQA